MNQELALRILASIMNWDDSRAREEYAWLRLMSRLKYDQYRDFLAGMRFVESLADWLQQFQPEEREAAYQFVRQNLVYIGPSEMQHLVELTYPESVQPKLLTAVADQLGIPFYLVWSRPEAVDLYNKLLRCSLFLGLSDGARIDAFRRTNAGLITNEQVVGTVQVEDEKWDDLLKDLQDDIGPDARFRFVFAIDDFTASGTSLLRKRDSKWKGKMPRLWTSIEDKLQTHFTEDYELHIHHYIGSHDALNVIKLRQDEAAIERKDAWFRHVEFSVGMALPKELPITDERQPEWISLVNTYYDPVLENKHAKEGGTDDVRLGFGACALPVVLEHNTPNNSFPLLWAETDGTKGKAMRPLFRRRQRHG